MKLGIVKTHFPNERRIPLLPQDIRDFPNTIYVETGSGNELGISDEAYSEKGAIVASKERIFAECDGIFSLKIIQPEDYHLLREDQIIIGWTHPLGSGKEFMKTQALPKKLVIADLDNRFPTAYYNHQRKQLSWIPSNFIRKNSFYAGYAGTFHALLAYGLLPSGKEKIAVLGAGNVAQGAFHAVSKITSEVTLFYRRTLPEFKEQLADFDIIINGIEVGDNRLPILSTEEQQQLKNGCFIIDIAADAGNAIENDRFTTIAEPIYYENNHFFYCVPNTPSLVHRTVSPILSRQFTKYIYSKDISIFKDIFQSSNR